MSFDVRGDADFRQASTDAYNFMRTFDMGGHAHSTYIYILIIYC